MNLLLSMATAIAKYMREEALEKENEEYHQVANIEITEKLPTSKRKINQNTIKFQGYNDLLIASIALSHNLILVTHNTKEFIRVEGLQIEDWEIER
jgi:predicted nucleic acid-binding protein